MTWAQDKALRHWLKNNRLDGFAKVIRSADKNDEKKMAILNRLRNNAFPAAMKLQEFMTELKN